jgi:hypothetical protein
MAKKILKGAGKLLGIGGKKKAAEPATVAEPKGPIIKPLAMSTPEERRRRAPRVLGETILSDKLGG